MLTEKTDKKELILDIAEKLFSQKGFDGVSTRLISSEAGVNMAMLNYYFGSKDGLFKAVILRRLGSTYQTLLNLNDENISSWDKLNKCIDIYADRILGNNCFHKIISRELSLEHRSEATDVIVESAIKNSNEIKRIIIEGIENGSFKAVDVDMTIATIIGTKSYLLNSTLIASRVLNMDLSDPEVITNKLKPRLKKYLHELLKSHLTKHDTHN